MALNKITTIKRILITVSVVMLIFITVFTMVLTGKPSKIIIVEQETPTTITKKIKSEYKLAQTIFKQDCNKCHHIKGTDNLLVGTVQRYGKPYLKLFITKQDSLVTAKNATTLHIKNKFNNMANAHNFNYTNTEVTLLVDFLDQ